MELALSTNNTTVKNANKFANSIVAVQAPSNLLVSLLAPQKVKDPLGIGITNRPNAPIDPDTYDISLEQKEYSRSLLNDKDISILDEQIKSNGYLSIDEVRTIISANMEKNSDNSQLDGEMLAFIDARINYKIFLVDDNVYTRSELYDSYPFFEFNVQPEAIFTAQVIGVFEVLDSDSGFEYVVKDEDDQTTEIMLVDDLVKYANNPSFQPRRPVRIVKTKIYAGKERWSDFKSMQQVFRSVIRVKQAQSICGAKDSGILSIMGASSKIDLDQPKIDLDQPKIDLDQPKIDLDQPKIDLDQPKIDLDQPKIEQVDLDQPKTDKVDLDQINDILNRLNKIEKSIEYYNQFFYYLIN